MSASDITDLIARLEEATEGSRDLDADIWDTLMPGLYSIYYRHQHAPAYSVSMDAALTLVPNGWTWAVNNTATDEGTEARAEVNWDGAALGQLWGSNPVNGTATAGIG